MRRRTSGQTALRMIASVGAACALLIGSAHVASGEPVVDTEFACEAMQMTPSESTETSLESTTTTATTTAATEDSEAQCSAPETVPTSPVTTTTGNSREVTPTSESPVTEPTSSSSTSSAPSSAAPGAEESSTFPSVPTTSTAPLTPIARAGTVSAADAIDGITVSAVTRLVGPMTPQKPGQIWQATVQMSVSTVNTTRGWTSSVSLSRPRHTSGAEFTPSGATYSAPQSTCIGGAPGATSPAVSVNLNQTASDAKRGGIGCNSSWTATVSIPLPSTGLLAGDYSTTLTHSVF